MEDAQVVELLKRVVRAVDDAGVPDDLRGAAFGSALQLLSGQGGETTADGAPTGDKAGEKSGTGGAGVIARVAEGLGIGQREAAGMFAEQDGQPVLKIKPSRLPSSKTAATHDIALLVIAARQIAGTDAEGTSTSVIREACRQHGKLDNSNFSRHLGEVSHLVSVRGKNSAATRELTLLGLEEAADVAKRYALEGQAQS